MREFYLLREQELEKAATILTQDDPRARAFFNVDKLSMVILHALPTTRFIPTTDEFREAVASIMGVASPLCRSLIGKRIHTVGRSRDGFVDGMGFNLTTTWGVEKQPRLALHNSIAAAVASEAKLAGWLVRETPEDILFTDATLPPLEPTSEGTASADDGNPQTKMIPDIVMGPPDLDRPRLYDIKTLGNTRQYTQGPSTIFEQCHVINDRGSRVNQEYRTAARRIDRRLQPELAPHEKGTLESKLNQYGEVKGLAFGFYSEASSDVHDLIRYWIRARTESTAAEMGIDEDHAALRVRHDIMHSIGMQVALGWARLKISILNNAVLGREYRPRPRVTPVTHHTAPVNYLPPLPLPLAPVWGAV